MSKLPQMVLHSTIKIWIIDYKKEISDIEAEFIPSQVISGIVTPAGYVRTITLDLDYTEINLLKDLLKYKKINARVYNGNKYTDFISVYCLRTFICFSFDFNTFAMLIYSIGGFETCED